jgi:hypothetical protein
LQAPSSGKAIEISSSLWLASSLLMKSGTALTSSGTDVSPK